MNGISPAERESLARYPNVLLTNCFAERKEVDAVLGGRTYNSIFVIRDPRDLVVSWYFSTRFSHTKTAGVLRHRAAMQGLDVAEGLSYAIRAFATEFVPIIESWARKAESDLTIRLVRFEDLIGAEGISEWRAIRDHLSLGISDAVLQRVLQTYSVDVLRGKAKVDPTRVTNKYGAAGRRNWRDHLRGRPLVEFEDSLGGLVTRLGYS